jgi:transcriptional regulator with XRE-family HTH domain
MTQTAVGLRRHFATMLSGAMDQLDITIRELSKQVGISCQHARRLQDGKALPSRLVLEKIATAVGLPSEELQDAVQRDSMRKKNDAQ